MTILLARPVVMSLELAAFLLRGKHDYDTNILLPHDVPEILFRISVRQYFTMGNKLTLKVAGKGPCVAMYRLFEYDG